MTLSPSQHMKQLIAKHVYQRLSKANSSHEGSSSWHRELVMVIERSIAHSCDLCWSDIKVAAPPLLAGIALGHL